MTYTLTDLTPSTHYRIEISAKNALGSSHPTSLIFQTAGYTEGAGKRRMSHLCCLYRHTFLVTLLLCSVRFVCVLCVCL